MSPTTRLYCFTLLYPNPSEKKLMKLYRTFISPQNYTAENPLWKSAEPTFDSYYCIWDTFRFTHPLFNIIVPEAQSQFIQSLIDIYRHEGWLPECRSVPSCSNILTFRMSFCKGITQSGSNADTLLTDAYIKGIKDVPWEEAFLAIQKVIPPNQRHRTDNRTQKWSHQIGVSKEEEI